MTPPTSPTLNPTADATLRRVDKRAGDRRRAGDAPLVTPDFAAAEREFLVAMQAYKLASGRLFPTWSEVLEVLRDLGYRKAGEVAR